GEDVVRAAGGADATAAGDRAEGGVSGSRGLEGEDRRCAVDVGDRPHVCALGSNRGARHRTRRGSGDTGVAGGGGTGGAVSGSSGHRQGGVRSDGIRKKKLIV